MTETEPASRPIHSRKSLKSRQKTPAERISSASAYRGFTVNMEIKLSFRAGVVRLKDYYEKNPATFENAIRLALERREHGEHGEHGVADPEVMKISSQDTTIHIELLYRSEESLLSVKKNYKKSNLKVEEELKEKVLLNEKITMTIANMEELDKKLNQIR